MRTATSPSDVGLVVEAPSVQGSAAARAQRELAIRWKAGDPEAGRLLIEACQPQVTTIARQYRRWGAPFEDLVQQGNIGLLQATKRFDPARGCRLATFANYWIRAEIRDYVTRNYRMVRLGASKAERRAVRFYRRAFVKDAPTLAEMTGLSERRAHALMPLLAGPDAPLDTSPHGDGLADGAPSPEAEVCRADERAWLKRAVKTALAELSPREQQVLERRVMSDEPATLAELGAAFGVSKERVRQVEERAKERMRGRLRALGDEASAPWG